MRTDWEPSLFNLGHVYRRQQRWDEAVAAFQQALGLAPHRASTLAALALTYHSQASCPVCLCALGWR